VNARTFGRGKVGDLFLGQRDGQAGTEQLEQERVPRATREHDPVGGVALARGGDRDFLR
jgi:hypothetical protein